MIFEKLFRPGANPVASREPSPPPSSDGAPSDVRGGSPSSDRAEYGSRSLPGAFIRREKSPRGAAIKNYVRAGAYPGHLKSKSQKAMWVQKNALAINALRKSIDDFESADRKGLLDVYLEGS